MIEQFYYMALVAGVFVQMRLLIFTITAAPAVNNTVCRPVVNAQAPLPPLMVATSTMFGFAIV